MRVAEGSVLKRCACRHPDRRRVGAYCPKLRRADGSWHSHHGVWAYQLELPPTADGSRRMLRRIPAARVNTRQAALAERDHARDLIRLAGEDDQARAEVATILQQVRTGRALPGVDEIARMLRLGSPDAAAQTLGHFLAGWITERVMDDNTRRNYAAHIANHLIPFLGHLPLLALKPWHVENMFADIAKRNVTVLAELAAGLRRKATPGAPRFMALSTMHRVRSTLRKALNDAIRKHGLLEVNAAARAELPTADLPKPILWTDARVRHWQATGKIPGSVMVWTLAQSGQFLDHVERHDPDLYPVFSLIIHRGTRRGESARVRTDQIDLEEATAAISHQITCHGTQPIYKRVKTRTGIRETVLDRRLTAVLGAYGRRRAMLREQAGAAWPDTVPVREYVRGSGYLDTEVDLFFRQPNGTAWHPGTLSQRFEQYAAEAGLPPCGIHDGRHASATYTKAAGGTLTDIKDQLGLATLDIADQVYTTVLRDTQRRLAKTPPASSPGGPRRRAPADPRRAVPIRHGQESSMAANIVAEPGAAAHAQPAKGKYAIAGPQPRRFDTDHG